MAQITQYFDDIRDLTYTASAPVTGGQLVSATTGDRQVAPSSGATDVRVVGVAAYDAAAGEKVNVLRQQMVPLSGPAVTAGDKLVPSGTAGVVAVAGVTPDARLVVGQAVETALAGAPFRAIIF